MRILFIGGTKRGWLTLKALLEQDQQVVGVISLQQDEHEVERYEIPIRELAEHAGIPHILTRWMKDRDYQKIIKEEMQPEVILIVGCRILIPVEIYSLAPLGALAVHDSFLPEYRGFAPLNWSILNGEDHTGVTLFYLSEKMDGGDIVAQKRVPIGDDETAPEVYDRVCQATVDVILEACPQLEQGTAPRLIQSYAKGSFTCSRTPADGMIDWTLPARVIYNQVRALAYPYPGAFTFYEGKKLMIWRARMVQESPNYVGCVAGRVVGISKSEGWVDVLTGDGILRISEVQAEGGEKTAAAVVVRSIRGTLGLRVGELLERISQLEKQVGKVKG